MGLGEFLTDACTTTVPDLSLLFVLKIVLALGSWADEMEDVPVPCKLSILCFLHLPSLTLKKLVSYSVPHPLPFCPLLRIIIESFKVRARDMALNVHTENGAGVILIQVSLAVVTGHSGSVC